MKKTYWIMRKDKYGNIVTPNGGTEGFSKAHINEALDNYRQDSPLSEFVACEMKFVPIDMTDNQYTDDPKKTIQVLKAKGLEFTYRTRKLKCYKHAVYIKVRSYDSHLKVFKMVHNVHNNSWITDYNHDTVTICIGFQN